MSKIKLEILGLSSSQSQSGSFALVLGEEQHNRRLPIIIGMFEAQAIAIEMEKITSTRPLTHDLFKGFAEAFHFDLEEVIITDLKDGVFYAQIICIDRRDGRRVKLDARPSDAIAIGLRFKTPIFTYESILEEAGIVINESDEEEGVEEDTQSMEKAPSAKEMTMRQLEEALQAAIDTEDYEKAAYIRDEIKRRES
ncbi:MAG: bifunctional nuclease domain-containing protein [Bernardetiaceae bacterium]